MPILLVVRCRTPLPIIVTSQSFAKPNPTVQRMTSNLLQVSIMIMVFVTLHGNFDQEIWNLDDQDAYYVGATTRASMNSPEDTFGCKVCSVGKKHCINVCTHCKIGWKKEPFACRKCQFGSKAGKYNCQLCRRNEDIAFEDTTKCRKNESVGIERSQGGTKEL